MWIPRLAASLSKIPSRMTREVSHLNAPLNIHSYVNSAGVYTVEIRLHPYSPDQLKVKTEERGITIELLTLHGSGENSVFHRMTKYVDIPAGFDHKMIKSEYKNGYVTLSAYKK